MKKKNVVMLALSSMMLLAGCSIDRVEAESFIKENYADSKPADVYSKQSTTIKYSVTEGEGTSYDSLKSLADDGDSTSEKDVTNSMVVTASSLDTYMLSTSQFASLAITSSTKEGSKDISKTYSKMGKKLTAVYKIDYTEIANRLKKENSDTKATGSGYAKGEFTFNDYGILESYTLTYDYKTSNTAGIAGLGISITSNLKGSVKMASTFTKK